MNKVKTFIVACCILVVVCAIACYWYSQLPPSLEDRLKNAEETARWVKAIHWDRVKDSMSREEYEKGPTAIHCNKVLEFFKDRKSLELPQIVDAMITAPIISMDLEWLEEESKKNIQREILYIDLYWLEDGFSTEGARMTQIKGDRRQIYKLPIITKFNFWDPESRRMHKETAYRFGVFPVTIGDTFALKNSNDSGSPVIVFPRDILESKLLISIYDSKGNEGKPVELTISENAREVILQQSANVLD